MDIDSILKQYEQFGIRLGLANIKTILDQLGSPQDQFPIIHVAGTNGKGSVCAYLSTILTEAGYIVGRYTSPHLVNWTERICINQEPITEERFNILLQQVQSVIDQNQELPTLFEIVTAVCWLYFAQEKVR